MDRNFSRALDAVLDYEGGFVNHPKDPGGPTNLGVTLANFRRFVKPDGTVDDLKRLTRDQAGVVFRRNYWDEVLASSLPDGVDFAVFDFAVNSGPVRAAKFLQRLVGVAPDGKVGPKTIEAVEQVGKQELITAFCDARMDFLQDLSTYATFGRGWKSRVDHVRVLAAEMAAQKHDAPVVIVKPIETPVEVPAIPKGADKPGIGRWFGGFSLTGFIGLLTDIPTEWKIAFGAVAVLGVIALYWRGEQIAMRAKAVIKSFQ